MKISQKQASILAKEIVNQLKSKKMDRVPANIKSQIEVFVVKRRELVMKNDAVQNEINKHDLDLRKITGNIEKIYTSDGTIEICKKLEEKYIPKQQEIEDEIILKAMFANEDDMQKFVEAIVSKHSKKLQSKILSN